ncbi:TonB family protein [Ruegeria sp. 2205SS24-7]|uniref:energy transducer TonB family protein n=1 Tax=Ruegeria discodermiae TaxID=3064389 RepID=UPI0027417C81|nr:TonB family protein [Ruegeria sp. 2205SS24-7]MDP5218083.1 TonB family protein [Ruegeria sp. 2205SS24-7]
MIRRSALVAVVALVVSLLGHLVFLSFTVADLSETQAGVSPSEAVELGSAFEDFADAPPEPVQPDAAEVPEPPVEETVEPEQAEIPTSDALVASADPQDVSSPDIGAQPDAPEAEVSDPVEPSEADTGSSDENTVASVEPDTTVETPQEPPAAGIETAEVPDAEASAPPEPQVSAALSAPDSAVVPVVPSESDLLAADIPATRVEPLEDGAETPSESETQESEQAVVVSKRPRLPSRRPPAEPRGTLNGFSNFDNLRNPQQTVDSPLTLFQRDSVDAFASSRTQSRSGGRGPGNSNVTNYAGQVLVHLNRAPVVYVSVRGFAQVFFEINPDGSLAWVDIVDSSGSPELERAAKEQVRRAVPFPPPPQGVSRKLSFYYQNS